MLKLLKQKIKYQVLKGLATNAALSTLENKIPDISSLVNNKKIKKTHTDYKTKITEIEKNHDKMIMIKYINTPEFNKLAARGFIARLAQENLVAQTDFDNKLRSLNQNINSNKTKHFHVENELKKLQTFDSIYFRGKSHFEEDGTQNYLVFQPMY